MLEATVSGATDKGLLSVLPNPILGWTSLLRTLWALLSLSRTKLMAENLPTLGSAYDSFSDGARGLDGLPDDGGDTSW